MGEHHADTMPAALHRLLVAYGRFVFRYRDYLAPILLVAGVALTRPYPFLGDMRADVWLDALGIGITLCGQALRVGVIGLAYIQRGGHQKQIAADHLVCEGLFAHSRNPLYLGNFLLIAGLTVIWNSFWLYLAVLLTAGTSLFSMVLAEEDFLRGKFGAEFDAYCARINRFVPRLRGLRATIAAFDFDWKRVVRKEYGTTFTWVSMTIVLVGLERLVWLGQPAAVAVVTRGVAVWLGVFAIYLFTRWLKKSHRLESPDF